MNYSQAITYIHNTHKFGRKLGLRNIKTLLGLLGNPEDSLKIIHVAGTNGKGSTSSFIYSALMKAGKSVGLYSSPFLQVFNERIRVNDEYIDNESLAELTALVKSKIDIMLEDDMDHPTEFEIVTAIAFLYYKKMNVDFVVLEVGMGGRLDSTNAIRNKICSVITPVAMDHVDYLGNTLGDIAGEKAGIIKEQGLCIIHPQEKEALEKISLISKIKSAELIVADAFDYEIVHEDLKGTKFIFEDEIYKIKLLGRHQIRNAIVAITVLRELHRRGHVHLNKEFIYEGLKSAVWPGRLEIIHKDPVLMIDGAHNTHGAGSLKEAIKGLLNGKRIIGVIGMLEDKDVDGVLKEIAPYIDYAIATEPNSPRKLSYLDMHDKLKKYVREVEPIESITQSIHAALSIAEKQDVIIAFGSLYMIGEIRSIFRR